MDKPGVAPKKKERNSGKKKRPPTYRVLLHNDSFNKREYVVLVLMKVVDSMTVDMAVSIMHEAHYNGVALVIECSQEEAEDYTRQLRGNGLTCTLEPGDA